jgi:GTPase SAR1 family protein
VRVLLNSIQKLKYKAFGLTIYSDIPLPELTLIETNDADWQVSISLNGNLKYIYNGRPFEFVIEDEFVTFMIPEIGVFQVKGGEEIIVSPFDDANLDIIRLYTLGSCFGALLLQRGIYPLHGSAIAIDDKAYAIVGDSGAGKSTLASAFMEKGYPLLSDDVIAITLSNKDSTPIVIPSYPQQKLWQQSLDAFGVSNNKLKPIYGRETKFCIPVNEKYHSSQLPLAGIFELSKTDVDAVSMKRITGLEQIQKLFIHTYRQFLIPKMKLEEWHFNQSIKIAERIPLYHIKRPTIGFSVFDIAGKILSTILPSVKNISTK